MSEAELNFRTSYYSWVENNYPSHQPFDRRDEFFEAASRFIREAGWDFCYRASTTGFVQSWDWVAGLEYFGDTE